MSITLSGVAYGAQIAAAARHHGLDPRLLAAVAAQETGGPGADSGRNIVGDGGHGRGLFQIDDRFHSFASSPAAMDPSANADYAAGMLSGLLRRYGGDVHKALSAYNAGSPDARGTPTTWQDGRVLGYADSVMRHYASLGGALPDAKGSDMSSFLGHIVHGLESGLTALATTANPVLAAGAGLAGALAPDAAGSPSQMQQSPLFDLLNAENPTERRNVNSLSSFANGQTSAFAELVNS
jgi:hypothetical protein